MSTDQVISEIGRMSLEDCLAVAEAVRRRLTAAREGAESEEEFRADLDRRLEDYERNPRAQSSWAEFRDSLKSRQ